MHILTSHGLHDFEEERWNAYGQFTYISTWKLPFSARYTNANGSVRSLLPDGERSFTASASLFLGAHLWPGGEAYIVPEVIALRPLSGLNGLGGAVQNFELQKTGSASPRVYRARTYLQQTIGLGGTPLRKSSDPLQLATTVTSRRLVLRIGNFTILDFLDRNALGSDPRQQFFNMAFMTYAAYDFASDARGYSWGGIAELYWDAWAVRFGRISPPKHPNTLPVDLRLDRHYGDQIELERKFELLGHPGAVRLLAYSNRALVGRFDDAVAAYRANPTMNAANCGDRYNYNSENTNAPDLCWVRNTHYKRGIGASVEQFFTDEIGVFVRGMVSDGNTEVYAYMPADRSLAFGALGKGSAWKRPHDVAGVGAAFAWISKSHAEFLRLGGVDGFIGDGYLTQGTESVLEAFYSVNLLEALWLSADYQHITNPAFNADRGPVEIFGARMHAEF